MQQFFTRNQAAAYLGISAQTLANNRRHGPAYHKVFGAVRYSKTDLDNWTRQQRVQPAGNPSAGNVYRLGKAA